MHVKGDVSAVMMFSYSAQYENRGVKPELNMSCFFWTLLAGKEYVENGSSGSKMEKVLEQVSFQVQWQGQISVFPKVLGKGSRQLNS